jgi:hypothetical protein
MLEPLILLPVSWKNTKRPPGCSALILNKLKAQSLKPKAKNFFLDL